MTINSHLGSEPPSWTVKDVRPLSPSSQAVSWRSLSGLLGEDKILLWAPGLISTLAREGVNSWHPAAAHFMRMSLPCTWEPLLFLLLQVTDGPSVLLVSAVASTVTLGTAKVTKDAPVIFFCFLFLLACSEGFYCYNYSKWSSLVTRVPG